MPSRATSSPARIGLGVSVIAIWSAAMLWAGRGAPAALAAAFGLLFTIPLASLGEWLVHGLLYHRAVPGLAALRRIHHHGHHFALFPPHRYAKSEGYAFMRVRAPLAPFRMADNRFDEALTKWSQVGLHLSAGIPLILAPAWALTGSVPFFAGAAASLCLVSWLLAHVHGAIHTPRGRWIEGQRWFRWLDRHHYIHHVDLSANINFMLPLCDLLFGTYKPALSDLEARTHPSYEAVRAAARPPGAARAHSVRGRR